MAQSQRINTIFRKDISTWSQERGFRVGIGGIDLLKQVNEELERRKKTKEINPNLSQEYLSFNNDLNNSAMKHSKSLIVVAVPKPAHIVSFAVNHKIIEMILPPTYVGYRKHFETVRRDLEKNVLAEKAQIITLTAPLKALANLLGVVTYGRNNLTYTPEFGSYLQLAAYLVDIPIPAAGDAKSCEKQMLKECAKCKACTKACPMGVISQDRFLIHAEKCYTCYSESPSPIPSGIHSPSPNCIIGCMQCQLICPVNKGRLRYENSGVLFSSDETHAILNPKAMNSKLSDTIEAKFLTLGLSENSDILFRNFRNFMKIKNTTHKKRI